jgi:uncharacterized protein
MTSEEIIEIIKQYFKDKPVKKVYLFGSFARGETNFNDVDVLVDFERGITLLDYVKYVNELQKLIGKPIDVIAEKGLSKAIAPYVVNDKMLIYG